MGIDQSSDFKQDTPIPPSRIDQILASYNSFSRNDGFFLCQKVYAQDSIAQQQASNPDISQEEEKIHKLKVNWVYISKLQAISTIDINSRGMD